VLSSVAGNLRISEIVDEPNFVVTLAMPKALLEGVRREAGYGQTGARQPGLFISYQPSSPPHRPAASAPGN